MLRRLLTATALLILVEFVDELYSGVVGLSAAEVQAEFSASYTQVSAALLLAPALVALFFEPFLFVLADRYPRKWFLAGGTMTMGLGGLLAAGADSLASVGAALSLAYLGSGAGVVLAQATLVDRFPAERERWLARWTLSGELGDLLAPVLVGALLALDAGWRGALLVVSAAIFLWGTMWCIVDQDEEHGVEADSGAAGVSADEEEPSLIGALGVALRNRSLVSSLAAAALCDFMDDLLTVFAVLYLRDMHGADAASVSLVVGAGVAGSTTGLMVCDRILLRRFSSARILWVTSALCALSYGVWRSVEGAVLLALSFFAVGFTAAPMYPITIARAYAALPGKSGTVNAIAHLFTPLSLCLPLSMGLIADHLGLTAALSLILMQPTVLFVVGLRARPSMKPTRIEE